MTQQALRFRATTGAGHYDVEIRETDKKLGSVVKTRRYYNLHPRGLWVTSWTAHRGFQSIKDGGGQAPATFGTRAEAAQALLTASQEKN